jgi:hypothetical protein
MTATFSVATSGSRPEPIRATYRRLLRMGFDSREAANLTALRNGIGITLQPWAVRELAHMLFMRESRRIGRCWSDDNDRVDADPADGAVTLLTLFRSIAGPNATLDQLRRPAPPRLDAASSSAGEGG